MDTRLKLKDNIDWEYSIKEKYNSDKPKKEKLNFNIWKSNSSNINFSNFTINNKYTKNIRNIKNSKKVNNGIYYGILFILIFGFLFFLTMSVSFALPMANDTIEDEIIYNDDKSLKLMSEYLLINNKENIDINNTKNNIFKKIEYKKYRVKKNDNYERIANKFGLSIDTLLLVNNINNNKILKIGSILIIPNQDGRIITVKENDSIFKIANRYGLKWTEIVDTNAIESSILIPGTRIFLPGSKMTDYEKNQFYGNYCIWPIKGKITSYFGPRIDPFTGTYGFHTGLDIKNKFRSNIKVAMDGKVVFIGWEKVYGNFIMIKHGNNLITIYGHLNEILVKKDQNVKQGEIIGKMGTSGRSTGTHLHFEVRKNGKLMDPLSLLNN